jgi:hypothetical protein
MDGVFGADDLGGFLLEVLHEVIVDADGDARLQPPLRLCLCAITVSVL